MRMLQREMEKEDTKSSKKRKEAKHNYAAKVLGNLGTLGEVRRRPGGKEGGGEGVVGKRREERKRMKEQLGEEEEITETGSKTKRMKRRAVDEDDDDVRRTRKPKPVKRREEGAGKKKGKKKKKSDKFVFEFSGKRRFLQSWTYRTAASLTWALKTFLMKTMRSMINCSRMQCPCFIVFYSRRLVSGML